MEDDARWMAAGLFSPSKARQQEAQAKDWLYVDDWLREKYAPNHVPTFERNEETLQVLMTLVASNERADEQRDIIDNVEHRAFEDIKARSVTHGHSIVYEAIEATMDANGSSAVESMAKTSVGLDCVTVQPDEIAHCLIQLTSESFDISEQLRKTELLRQVIASEHDRLRQVLRDIAGSAFVPPSDLQAKTTEWARGTKHLKAKLTEYNDRLSSTADDFPSPTMEDIESQKAEVDALRAQSEELRDRLKVFQGLSRDPTEARSQVEDARARLKDLSAQRDERFEKLVHR